MALVFDSLNAKSVNKSNIQSRLKTVEKWYDEVFISGIINNTFSNAFLTNHWFVVSNYISRNFSKSSQTVLILNPFRSQPKPNYF